MAFLAIMLGTATLTLSSFNEPEAPAAHCENIDPAIIDYLQGYGYQVVSLGPDGRMNCNRIAVTQYEYDTRVFVEDGQVIGHEDIAF